MAPVTPIKTGTTCFNAESRLTTAFAKTTSICQQIHCHINAELLAVIESLRNLNISVSTLKTSIRHRDPRQNNRLSSVALGAAKPRASPAFVAASAHCPGPSEVSNNTPSGSSTSIPLPKPETFKCGVEAASPELPAAFTYLETVPKQETFKCGVEGCKAPSFPQLSLLHQHAAEAHPKSSKNTPSGSSTSKPVPKPETFKCGVEGCKAPSFPQLSLLHQHTAKTHPKSSKNTPSGSSTSAFSTQGYPIPITNTASTSTSFTAQNAVSSPDHLQWR
ncbi:hypothetical protein B0H13DRAFT_2456472 [Mycena leptocephala]|nr:hypothetical protein B0H13DRAFT_2456472 [Mycena leptocephala]